MNSRRSRSVKLVSSTSLSIEVELGENSPMNYSVDNTVYCCVAKGSEILYSYSGKDDAQLERLAIFCLENPPAFHRWYFHSVGPRTLGFLMADGHTYFAIIDPSVGNSAILRFLEHIRDGFMKNGFQDELMPVIQRLIETLENMPRSAFSLDDSSEGGIAASSSGDGSTSTKAPLLGKNWNKHHHERKKMKKDKAVVQTDGAVADHGLKIDVAPNMSLPRSSSSSRLSMQQGSRRLSCRRVKIIIAVDLVICLLLFVAWLAVCKGFACVS